MDAGHTRWVWDCVFSVDAAYLVTASSDTTARLWDLTTGERGREGGRWLQVGTPLLAVQPASWTDQLAVSHQCLWMRPLALRCTCVACG
jgi:WD40 repeat protein